MDTVTVIYVIGFYIAVIAIIILIAYTVILSTQRIDPIDCPVSLNPLTVIPGAQYVDFNTGTLAVVNMCGQTGLEPCTQYAPTLSEALAYCNITPLCQQFVYSITTQTVTVVMNTGILADSTEYDLYTVSF